MSSPLGLVLTIERNSIIGWIFGGVILGAAYGSIFSTIGDIIGSNPTYRKILGVTQIHAANRELILNFLNMLSLFFVAIAAISGNQMTKRAIWKSFTQKVFLRHA